MKKKIVVLGAGLSGVGAAVLAKKKGFKVFVSVLICFICIIIYLYICVYFSYKKDIYYLMYLSL